MVYLVYCPDDVYRHCILNGDQAHKLIQHLTPSALFLHRAQTNHLSFYPRDTMIARSLRQRRVCLSGRPLHAGTVRKRCILDTKLLWDGNRKPYASYQMVLLSMTSSDP